jgi:hypothetical protein
VLNVKQAHDSGGRYAATPPIKAKEPEDEHMRVPESVEGLDFALAGYRFLKMDIVLTPVISDHKTLCAGYLRALFYYDARTNHTAPNLPWLGDPSFGATQEFVCMRKWQLSFRKARQVVTATQQRLGGIAECMFFPTLRARRQGRARHVKRTPH